MKEKKMIVKESENIYEKLANLIIEGIQEDENISSACLRSGLSRETYYRILRHKTDIDLNTFFKVAILLKSVPYKVLNRILKETESIDSLKNKLYKFDKKLLSIELRKKIEDFKEIGISIESLFYEEMGITKRHFEYILAAKKGCSLGVYLNICDILRIDPVETMKKITVEENEDGIKTNG